MISKKKLDSFNECILGNYNYEEIGDFFEQVFGSDAIYKVFLSPRCLNLMYAFYPSYKAKKDSIYSDKALLANVSEIARVWLQFGAIPNILLVADVLSHGCHVNTFLHSLIDKIYQYCIDQGVEVRRRDVEQSVVTHLRIMSLSRSRNLFINGTFLCRVECDNRESRDACHRRLYMIERFMRRGYYTNMAEVLSYYECKRNDKDKHSLFIEAARAAGFTYVPYNHGYRKDVCIRLLRNDCGDVVAVYALLIIQNSVNDRYRVTPFVITSDLVDVDNGNMVLTALSYNILSLLCEGFGEYIMTNRLDIERVGFNFRRFMYSEDATMFERLIKLKSHFMSWDEMDRFILDHADNDKPLFREISGGCSDAVGLIRRTIVEQYFREEESMYHQFEAKSTSVVDVNIRPIQTLFSAIQSKYAIDNEDIVSVMAELFRCLSDDDIVISTVMIDKTCQYVYELGGHAQFICSTAYSDYMDVLSEMEHYCRGNYRRMREIVTGFFKNEDKETMEGLLNYIAAIYKTGQSLSEWNMPVYDIETKEMITNDSEAEDLRMMCAASRYNRRQELYNRYSKKKSQ